MRSRMQLYHVNSIDPEAVCNDGSPGAYYHRPAAAGHRGLWVIQLMGGGWCTTGADCSARAITHPVIMSSSALQPTAVEGDSFDGLPALFGGVQSVNATQNPGFAGANHIFVWYCSSDCHMGDRAVQFLDGGAFQFRGRRIYDAVINSLLAQHGLADATDVLLAGFSAGGIGVLNSATSLLQKLKPKLPRLRRFKALVDAAVFLDVPQYVPPVPQIMPHRAAAQAMQSQFGAQWDPACAAAQPAGAAWRCFHAEHWPRAPGAVPFMFTQQLYDIIQMVMLMVPPPSQEDFRSRLSAVLRSRPLGAAAFASSCMVHETIGNAAAGIVTVGGRTEMEAITEWFFNDRQDVVVDNHEGLCAVMAAMLTGGTAAAA